MNTPLINPWFFYLTGVADSCKDCFMIFGGITVVIIVIFGFIVSVEDLASFKTLVKVFIGGAIIFTLGLLIPSQNTCYQMMAASLITPNNIESVQEGTIDLIDYIIDVSNELEEKTNKD